MCIVCDLKQALEEKRAEFEAARNPAQGEDLGKPEAEPAAAQLPTPEQEIEAAELEQFRAQTANINADSIFKLAQAANYLYDSNSREALNSVLRTLEQLCYPAPPVFKSESSSVEPEPANGSESDVPQELTELVEKMRAAGFEVDVVRIPL